MRLWENFVKITGNRFHKKIKAFSQADGFNFVYNESVKSVTDPFYDRAIDHLRIFSPKKYLSVTPRIMMFCY